MVSPYVQTTTYIIFKAPGPELMQPLSGDIATFMCKKRLQRALKVHNWKQVNLNLEIEIKKVILSMDVRERHVSKYRYFIISFLKTYINE